MLLSRNAILHHKAQGNIVIEPFAERKLQTASYDVALGEWFWREKAPSGRATVHNPYDERSTALVWEGPLRAETLPAIQERTELTFQNIPPHAKIILVAPGETVLAHTEEFIGGRNVCVSKLYARSSLGRNFVEVCKDAGWGDVGYINRWTMEITNNSRFFSIPLVVGRRIGQMVFYEVAPLAERTENYASEGGKYQQSADLADLIASWRPEMMVPRMHLDWEIKEGK